MVDAEKPKKRVGIIFNYYKMKTLKLLRINKNELNAPELSRIKGGACTNYDCQCDGNYYEPVTITDIDVELDIRSTHGYM